MATALRRPSRLTVGLAAAMLVLLLLLAVPTAVAAKVEPPRGALEHHHPVKELVPQGYHDLVVPTSQDDAIQAMSSKQLRRFLQDRGARCDGCVEKVHLVERAMEVRNWATADDLVVASLAPTVDSAATHLAVHHLTGAPEDNGLVVAEPQEGVLQLVHAPQPATALEGGQSTVRGQHLCEAPLVNGTSFCHSIPGMQKHAQAVM